MSDDQTVERVPDDLRDAISRDLAPVRPLARPWRRAAAVLPLAMAAAVGIPIVLGLRRDAGVLGFWWSWGVSSLQLMAGFILVSVALREAVPGSNLSKRQLLATFAAGAVVIAAVTLGTFTVSPRVADSAHRYPFFVYCLRHSAIIGAPAVIAAGLLASRALPLRPWVNGAIYGLGGGLMADAGWRLFCDVSAPGHVLAAHGGAVLLLTALGMLTASFGEWVKGLVRRTR